MKELNLKNREFCEEYVRNWYKGGPAYSVVYGQKDANNAAVGASQLLKQERIRNYIDVVEGSFKLIGHREWLDKSSLVKVLKEMLYATKTDIKGVESPDWTARNNAITTLSKLAGYWADWEKEWKGGLSDDDDNKSEVKVSDMTEEEKEIYRKKILESL
jgi:phage terminase small subunit